MTKAGYESKEYERLVKRNFKPYSKGHRMMYVHALERIATDVMSGGKKPTVFEAGFGIGWGLDKMLESGLIKSYVGVEPNADSFKYTNDRLGLDPHVELYHMDFDSWYAHAMNEAGYKSFDPMYDEAFCIEVIEHVPLAEQSSFLVNLRSITKRLWFSTPDKDRVPREGVRTDAEWTHLLTQAGFKSVVLNTSHWTTLYECQ